MADYLIQNPVDEAEFDRYKNQYQRPARNHVAMLYRQIVNTLDALNALSVFVGESSSKLQEYHTAVSADVAAGEAQLEQALLQLRSFLEAVAAANPDLLPGIGGGE